MYQKPWTQIVAENPDSDFSKFLVRFFSAKPDFTELDRKAKECEEALKKEHEAELNRRMAEKLKEKAVLQK